MASLVWRDTTDPDNVALDGPEECRVEGCRSKRRSLWRVTSDGYEDFVCLFHFAAYVFEFIVLTEGGGEFEASSLNKPSRPTRGLGRLNIPGGDISHILGIIPIEEPKH